VPRVATSHETNKERRRRRRAGENGREEREEGGEGEGERERGRERERERDNETEGDLPQEKREGFVVGALEDLLLLPALHRLHPFLARTAPVFGYERHAEDVAEEMARTRAARRTTTTENRRKRHPDTREPRPCPRGH